MINSTEQSITVYQVSDIVLEIKQMLEASYRNVWIEAELSSLSRPASGHWYFSLKDNTSQIRCAMFKGAVTTSFARSAYRPQEGDLVRVRGKVSVYPQRGDMQFIAQHMQPAGEGALRREFELLKAKLNAEGLFSQELKRPVPILPKCIGLVTSPTGAAVHDILSTLKRRFPSIPVRIYPSVVQGDTAAANLVSAIQLAEKDAQCDVLVVTRGGGSLEDLWSFNDEELARTVRACSIPVVSAVGHEVDVSICDYAADVRAATPTAAAEIITPDQNEYLRQLNATQQYLATLLKKRMESMAQSVDYLGKRLVSPSKTLSQQGERLKELEFRLKQMMSKQLTTQKSSLEQLAQRFNSKDLSVDIKTKQLAIAELEQSLMRQARQTIKTKQDKLSSLMRNLHAVSPLATLDRGYAIAAKDSALTQIIEKNNQVAVGDDVFVELGDGALECEVKQKLNSKLSSSRAEKNNS